MREFAARFGDLKVQSFVVIEPLSLALRLGLINGTDGERHAGAFTGVQLNMPPILPPDGLKFTWIIEVKKPRGYRVYQM